MKTQTNGIFWIVLATLNRTNHHLLLLFTGSFSMSSSLSARLSMVDMMSLPFIRRKVTSNSENCRNFTSILLAVYYAKLNYTCLCIFFPGYVLLLCTFICLKMLCKYMESFLFYKNIRSFCSKLILCSNISSIDVHCCNHTNIKNQVL